MTLIEDYNRQIREIIITHPNCYATVLKSKKNKHLVQYIMEMTCAMPDILFPARIYFTLNDIHTYPRCKNPTCPTPGGKELRHDARYHPLRGAAQHCCSKCALLDPEVRKDIKQRSIERCGYEYPQQSPEARKKLSDKLKSLPDEHWEKAQQKREQTNLRERGVKSVSQDPEVKKKMSETYKSRSDEQKADTSRRTDQTKRKRYGDDYRKVIAEKGRSTRYEKNDGKWESEDTLPKRIETTRVRYGVDNVLQCKEIAKKLSHTRRVQERTRIYNEVILKDEYVQPLFTLDEFINLDESAQKLKWKCKKCGNVFEQNIAEHQFKVDAIVRCLKCFPLLAAKSQTEKSIASFISTIINEKVIENSRSIIFPKELDVYVPHRKIAIELNGTYWHSFNMGTPYEYHMQKTQSCEDKGIKLHHLFDVEWNYRRDISEAYVRSAFGIYDLTVRSKECNVISISDEFAKSFAESNSLILFRSGYDQSFALAKDNIIYAICSLKLDNDHAVISNLCTKRGVKVVKPLLEFSNHFKELYNKIKFIDFEEERRFGNNKSKYDSIGFTFFKQTMPDEVLWDRNHSSKKICSSFNSDEKPDISTDHINQILDSGYYTIFSSGFLIFRKTF